MTRRSKSRARLLNGLSTGPLAPQCLRRAGIRAGFKAGRVRLAGNAARSGGDRPRSFCLARRPDPVRRPACGIDGTDLAGRAAELALDMAPWGLKGGRDALIKAVRDCGSRRLVQETRGRFAKVKLIKPAASRARSPEMHLLAKGFRLV